MRTRLRSLKSRIIPQPKEIKSTRVINVSTLLFISLVIHISFNFSRPRLTHMTPGYLEVGTLLFLLKNYPWWDYPSFCPALQLPQPATFFSPSVIINTMWTEEESGRWGIWTLSTQAESCLTVQRQRSIKDMSVSKGTIGWWPTQSLVLMASGWE